MTAQPPLQTLISAENPVRQCQSIFKVQIDCALRDLGEGGDLNVHGARKQLKRARATLRLIRPAIGENSYQQENAAVRDSARPLSRTRDAEVLAELVSRLAQDTHDAPAKNALTSLTSALVHQRGQATESPSSALEAVRIELHRVRTRLTLWHIDDDDWSAVSDGLKSTYKKGRQRHDEAQTEPSTEHLHDWRKQTKYTWHQLQLLTPLAAGPIGELADQFHRLSNYLGDDHDLAVLGEAVGPLALDRKSVHLVHELVNARRSELQGKAFALGKRLYEDPSKVLQKRFDTYWHRWHG